MRNIFQACAQAYAEGEPVALAMVIRASPSSRAGEKMLVYRDGSTEGRFWDDRLTDYVCQAGLAALTGGVSSRLAYVQSESGFVQAAPGDEGDVEIFIQVLQPSPTLLLIGAGHIGEALVRMSKLLGWHVVVVDDRADFITPERLPDADERILVRYEPHGESLDPMPVSITPTTFILLATWGWDEPALRQVVNTPAAYIGLVASARKSIIIFRDLMKEGISPDVLARVRVPTGLDLGAETPSEIALSILAEMLMVQRGATGMPLAQSKGSAVMTQSTKGVKK
ncbi:MAG TPA: XdhC/CoxI family protein [Anaerolineae bacterium]